MSKWYEVKCRYTEEVEGVLKVVTRPYLLSAVSFSEAEAQAYKHVAENIRGEFSVREVTIKTINDVFQYEDSDIYWYATVEYPIENEFCKETIVKNTFVVSANNIDAASIRINACLENIGVRFEVIELKKSKIVDVFCSEPDEAKETIQD